MASLRLMRRSVYMMSTLSLFLIPGQAAAGTAAAGRVTGILPTNAGAAFFNDDGARTGVPSCAQANTARWVVNDSTPAGQAMLSTLLTAYSLGRTITVTGTGTCDVDGSTETAAFFFIDD